MLAETTFILCHQNINFLKLIQHNIIFLPINLQYKINENLCEHMPLISLQHQTMSFI